MSVARLDANRLMSQETTSTGLTVDTPLWFEQKLDHFDPTNKDTFQQRYYDNQNHWDKTNGPVFLYIGGEGTLRAGPSEESFTGQLAKKFKGRVLALEHRYYGASQPKDDWSYQNLRWLSADQGLADLAEFASSMVPGKRIITIGGSYPGAMSSWFRSKYPHIAMGALSSSGVVDAVYDFYQFDEQVYNSALKSGQSCPDKLIELVDYIEEKFTEGDGQKLLIKHKFSNDHFDATKMYDFDFDFFIADVIVETIQYGDRTTLCEKVEEVGDDKEALLEWMAVWAPEHRADPSYYDTTTLQNTTVDFDKNMRQWTYQYCSQLAYFQTPGKSTTPIRSANTTLADWEEYCIRVFKTQITPDTWHWNMRYGAKHPETSHVIYTNGQEDPWKWASVLEEDNPQGAEIYPIEIKCDDCAHCVDLHNPDANDPQELTDARTQIEEILTKWLNGEAVAEKKNIPLADRDSFIKTMMAQE